ncbi:MAG TPA: response regulator [Gemmatimonadaceae bacterium]|nr:response regulator [Gemmatimonadaceae bacterium]
MSGRRILIIEDEHMLAKALSRALQETGADVVGMAATVEQALALLEATPDVDGALVDINLRGVRAYSVADALAGRGVPFVFTTGYSSATIPDRYRNITVLQKPYEAQEIIGALFG